MRKKHVGRGHVSHQQKNYCFGCGKNNPEGMRLRFSYDEDRKRFISRFRLGRRYTGPPGHAHGGVIATILDEAMGKVNKFRSVVALTRSMNVEYLRPVPLGQELTVTGWEQKVEGREHTNVAQITNADGDILARSTGIFVAVDIARMFAKHLNVQN